MKKLDKERINRRKIAFVYLMQRMFEGDAESFVRTMNISGVTIEDMRAWAIEFKDVVSQTIAEENSRGANPDEAKVPSIKSIKEKVLRRCNAIVGGSDDPAKLAQTYKILSEFEQSDDKKEKTVVDAIQDSMKPISGKSARMTRRLIDMINLEGKEVKRGRGRPRKYPLPEVVQEPEPQDEDITEEENETEEE